MTRARRILTRVGLTLVGLIGGLTLVTYVVSESRLNRRFQAPTESVPAADSSRIARGRHVATAIGGCTECHGPDLGGRVFIDVTPLGRWAAPNLTSGRGGAAARMTDAELERAIRHGIDRDGRSLHIMPSETYAALADDDLAAILGYLRYGPRVDRELPERRVGPAARAMIALNRLPVLSAELVPPRSGHTKAAPLNEPAVDRGRYLATIGGCHSCHGPGLSGGPMPAGPPGAKPASNLTRTGLAHYDEAAFVRALRHGVRPGGAPIDGELMPWRAFRHMTDDELRALWAYLHSVQPRPYGGR